MAGNGTVISDPSGNLATGPFGSPLQSATGKYAGVAIGGLNGSSNLTPFGIDAYGSLTVRPGVCPTHTTTGQVVVSTGTTSGKVMMSFYNNSSTYFQRVAALYATCPPQVNTTSGLAGIGSGTSYTPIYFGLYRITAHSGGTLCTSVMADPNDDAILSPDFTVRTGSTITGKATSANFAWDAAYDGSKPVGPRPDMCMKVWTMPPGYGFAICNVNALSTSVNFLMTVTCAQNIA